MRCLVLVGKDIELDAVGRQPEFEPYPYHRLHLHQWRPCGVTWDDVPNCLDLDLDAMVVSSSHHLPVPGGSSVARATPLHSDSDQRLSALQ